MQNHSDTALAQDNNGPHILVALQQVHLKRNYMLMNDDSGYTCQGQNNEKPRLEVDKIYSSV